MLSYRSLRGGRVFVEADQPPAVVTMAAAGTVGVTLDESDLQALLQVVREEGGESVVEKLTADRAALAGER